MNDESVTIRHTTGGRVWMGAAVVLLPLTIPKVTTHLSVEWGWSGQALLLYSVFAWLSSLYVLLFWFPVSFKLTEEGVYLDYVLRVGDRVLIERRSQVFAWPDVRIVDVVAGTLRSGDSVVIEYGRTFREFNRSATNFDRALLLVARHVPDKLTAEAQRWARASAKAIEEQDAQGAGPSS